MKSGKDILFDTFWSSQGWKNGTISQEDFEQAKSEGYMFDYPAPLTHEETLTKLKDILSQIDKADIANAFLYSLSTRSLEYRSALGSYYYAIAIPEHSVMHGDHVNPNYCYLCGWDQWGTNPNVFNFERFKFGGVRHESVDYVLFDLEQFLKLPKMTATEEDREILSRILGCVDQLDKTNKAGKLRDLITKERILRSNKNEIASILNILGITGILSSDEYPCFEVEFVDEYHRTPVENTNDFAYPINRWRAKDGINKQRFKRVFSYDYE